jgi:UDP-N-acetylglucosamine--N-acetylmuramyl-(pentapeptide) pyrophosphoryl-undecaprenol N-acetylglucosamine transferase
MLKRVIITAGGTGGHIFPALALAERIQGHDIEILFVGNVKSMEERICHERKIPFKTIDVQKLYRSITIRHLLFPYKLAKSLLMSTKIIGTFKPDACIGTGGFVSGPVMLCSTLQNIPFYLQEQNSYPGLTTRVLSKKAKKIYLGYNSAKKYLPPSNCLYTGNPLQNSLLERLPSSRNRKATNQRKTLLVLGGSQGARTINDCVLAIMQDIMDMDLNLLWQTGSRDYPRISESLNSCYTWKKEPSLSAAEVLISEDNRLTVFPFSSAMPDIYQRSDMAITRAGALSLAELEVNCIPAIIIPLSNSPGNHQYLNAQAQEENKGGVVIKQDILTPSLLKETIQSVNNELNEFCSQLQNSIHLTAAKTIVDDLLNDFSDTTKPSKNNKD